MFANANSVETKAMERLDTYLPYLLNRAGSRIALAFSDEVRGLGVTLQHWRVLAALRQRDAQRIGDLSAVTTINMSTLSRVLDAMEKSGLIARQADPADNRGTRVQVTPRGRLTTERILPIADRYERLALDGFTRAEADQLRIMLRRVFANIAGEKSAKAAGAE